MTKKVTFTLIASFLLLGISFAFIAKKTDKTEEAETVAAEKGGIKWMSMSEALAANKKKPKKIFVDVYTSWCGWCVKMDKGTFTDPEIAEYVNKKYYAVKLDAESQKKLVYNGSEMTEADLAVRVYGATGYPTTVYLDEKITLLSPVPGYLDIPSFTKIIKYFGEDTYKTTSWEQYSK